MHAYNNMTTQHIYQYSTLRLIRPVGYKESNFVSLAQWTVFVKESDLLTTLHSL